MNTPLTVSQSLLNLRKNVPLLALLFVLVVAYIALQPRHNEMIWTVALVLVVKAESRPQPVPVVVLALASTITSFIALSNYRGLGHLCEWLTIALLVPMVLSKWLFGARNQ